MANVPAVNITVRGIMAATSPEYKKGLPHGAFTRIAKSVRPQVTVQHVREVWLGRRPSKRIEAAIQRYVEKLEGAA